MTKKTAITSSGDKATVVVFDDETTITTEYREEHQPTLEDMQKFVGGYKSRHVTISDGTHTIANRVESWKLRVNGPTYWDMYDTHAILGYRAKHLNISTES